MSGSLNSLLPAPLSPLQPAASPLVKAPDSYDTADAYVSTKNALTDWVSDQRAQSSAMGLWDDQTGLPTAAGVKNALLSIALGTNSSGGGVAARSAGGRQGELALEAPVVAPVAAPAAVAEAAPVAAAPSVPVEAVPAPVPEPVPGIRAYHGSPAAFDRFSNDYIGTGEGAQAYGVGHYAAENEGIARSYRDALSQRSMSDPEDRAAYAAASDKGIAAIRGISTLDQRMQHETMGRPDYEQWSSTPEGSPDAGWGTIGVKTHPEVAAKYQPQMDALVAARDAAKADADAVAIKYNPAVGGQLYDSDNPIHRTAYYLDRNGGDVGRTLSAIDDELAMVDRNRQGWDNTKPYDDAAGRLNEMKQILQTDPGSVPPYKTPGHMYELNLRVDPERMLDWDKSLAEQSPHVQEALAKLLPPPKFKIEPFKGGFGVSLEGGNQPGAPSQGRFFATRSEADAWAGARGPNPSGADIYSTLSREADRVNLAHKEAAASVWSLLSEHGDDPEAAMAFVDAEIARLQRTGEDYARKGLSIEGTQYGRALQRLQAARPMLDNPELLSEEPLSGEALVSRQLHEAGVPGIRYLDASSRSGGQGTRNHVIFDPENIEIVRRYGLAGLLAGGGAAAASGAGGQQ